MATAALAVAVVVVEVVVEGGAGSTQPPKAACRSKMAVATRSGVLLCGSALASITSVRASTSSFHTRQTERDREKVRVREG
jgi:hypothetical protein